MGQIYLQTIEPISVWQGRSVALDDDQGQLYWCCLKLCLYPVMPLWLNFTGKRSSNRIDPPFDNNQFNQDCFHFRLKTSCCFYPCASYKIYNYFYSAGILSEFLEILDLLTWQHLFFWDCLNSWRYTKLSTDRLMISQHYISIFDLIDVYRKLGKGPMHAHKVSRWKTKNTTSRNKNANPVSHIICRCFAQGVACLSGCRCVGDIWDNFFYTSQRLAGNTNRLYRNHTMGNSVSRQGRTRTHQAWLLI